MAKKSQATKNINSYIVTAVIIVAAIAILGSTIWGSVFSMLKGYALKINDEKVSAGKLRYFLALNTAGYDSMLGMSISDDGSTFADYLYDQTINEIIYNVVCSQKARELGINYTAEDETEAVEAVKEFRELVTKDTWKYIGISEKELQKVYLETVLASLVYEHYTKDYTVNEADFDQYFIDYYDENRSTLVTGFGDYVATDSLEKAEAVIERVVAGEALNDLAAEYNNEEGRETFETIAIDTLPQEVIEVAVLCSDGDLTEVIEVKSTVGETEISTYYVVHLVSVVEPDMEALKNEQRETYITEQKSSIFGAEFSAWTEDLNVESNSTLLSMMTIQGAVTKEAEAAAQQTPDTETETDNEAGDEN